MKSLIEYARGYCDLGWSLVPVIHRSKLPEGEWRQYQSERATLEQLEKWFGNNTQKNIAVVNGIISGIVTLEFDGKKALEFTRGKTIPMTPVCQSQRGVKYLFRYLSGLDLSTKHFPNLEMDFLSNGSYVLLPPSVHPSGTYYTWEVSPFEQSLADIPDWLLEMVLDKKTGSKSQDGTVKAIVTLLNPFWVEPQRNFLTLSLGGFLAKSGWPYPLAEQLMLRLTEDDEEQKNRLRNLKDTYKRFQEGKSIRGYSALEEVLPQKTLEQLTELTKCALIPKEMLEVDRIRRLSIPAFDRKRRIANFVCESFSSAGEFIKVIGEDFYYFDSKRKKLMLIEGMDFQSILTLRFGLNGTEEEFRYTMRHLVSYTHEYGKACNVYRLCFYDRMKKILYVNVGSGRIARLDGQKIDIVENGHEGVLFLEDLEPVNPDLTCNLDLRTLLISDVNFTSCAISKEHQIILAWYWFITIFFFELLPARPLLAVIGPKGAGKTFFLKRILALLFGWAQRQLDSVSTLDAYEVTVSSRYLVALDNVDEESKWLNDALAKTATGMAISRRKLYTTRDVVELIPRCFIAVNSRTPEFRREDVADRLIILRVDRILENQYRTELKLIESVVGENRSKVWGTLLNELNSLVRFLKAHELGDRTRHRLADWSMLAVKLAEKYNEVELLNEALDLMERERVLFAVEDQPLIPVPDQLRDGMWKSAKDIWDLLGGIKSEFKSVVSLGKHLSNLSESLRALYGFKDRREKGKPKEYMFPKPYGTDGKNDF